MHASFNEDFVKVFNMQHAKTFLKITFYMIYI